MKFLRKNWFLLLAFAGLGYVLWLGSHDQTPALSLPPTIGDGGTDSLDALMAASTSGTKQVTISGETVNLGN